ncbi:MAG: CBS domain-containing protein [Myxococcales bacterium]
MLAPLDPLTVADVMSKDPCCIQSTETLRQAHWTMLTRGVRHLPVLEGERLVGVVSERDLYLVESVSVVDAEQKPVSAAMSTPPFTTRPDTALREVVHVMRVQRYGSSVVVDGERVVGIFTRNDALRALDDLG